MILKALECLFLFIISSQGKRCARNAGTPSSTTLAISEAQGQQYRPIPNPNLCDDCESVAFTVQLSSSIYQLWLLYLAVELGQRKIRYFSVPCLFKLLAGNSCFFEGAQPLASGPLCPLLHAHSFSDVNGKRMPYTTMYIRRFACSSNRKDYIKIFVAIYYMIRLNFVDNMNI